MMFDHRSMQAPDRSGWLNRSVFLALITAGFCVAGNVSTGNAQESDQQAGKTEEESQSTADDGTPSSAAAPEEEKRTLSPLHSFLKIDPSTGQFLPEIRRLEPAQDINTTTDNPTVQAPAPDEEPSSGDAFPQTSEEAVTAIRDLVDRLEDGSTGGLGELLTGDLDSDEMTALRKQMTLAFSALLLMYPLGIICSELVGWYMRREEPGLSELDTRYYGRRMRRRLTLAVLLGIMIAAVPVGDMNGFWWDQPELFTTFCAVLLGAALWSLVLVMLTRQAAKNYSVAIIRDIRIQQLELRQELQELRRLILHRPKDGK